MELPELTNENSRNRALDVRRDNDLFVVPSITIYDIDYAILWFLKEKIQPQVEENGQLLNVPIIYAQGEKWAQIQRQGYLRDANGKVMTPLIMIKRVSMTEDERYPKLKISNDRDGANSIIMYPATQKNNQNDFPRENNNLSTEFYISQIPTFMRVSYELVLWASTTAMLNTIVESIIPNDTIPWGDSFQFVTKIMDYSFDTMNNIGEDRTVKCIMQLQVDGKLQAQYNLKESTVQKAYSIKRMVFGTDIDQTAFIVDYVPKEIKPSEERLLNRRNKK